MVSIRPAAGYVYLVSNPSFPGLLKIGMTSKHPDIRIKGLYNTSVPTPFVLERVYHVNKTSAYGLENRIHQHLAKHRVNPKREFFRIGVDEAHQKISTMLNTRGRNYRLRKLLKKMGSVATIILLAGLVFYKRQVLLQYFLNYILER